MKNNRKYLLYFFSLLLSASCKNDPPILPKPGGANTSVSSTYQPVTTGSYWKYKNVQNGITDSTELTFDGKAILINGMVYYEARTTYLGIGAVDTSYVSRNPVYISRTTTYGVTISLYYLNDTTAVGHTWTLPIAESGGIQGIAGRFYGTIVAKGISKTVSGILFNNVIHSQVLLQYESGGIFNTAVTYDIYSALNVGIIELDSQGLGATGVEVITGYLVR